MERKASDTQASLACSATNSSFSECEKASIESTDPARLVSVTGVRFYFIIAAFVDMPIATTSQKLTGSG